MDIQGLISIACSDREIMLLHTSKFEETSRCNYAESSIDRPFFTESHSPLCLLSLHLHAFAAVVLTVRLPCSNIRATVCSSDKLSFCSLLIPLVVRTVNNEEKNGTRSRDRTAIREWALGHPHWGILELLYFSKRALRINVGWLC